MMLVENLVTPRLRFRRLTEEDEKPLMEFFFNDEAVRYFGIEAGNRDHCMAFLKRQFERYADGNGMCAMIDRVSGELVGQCGVLYQDLNGIKEIEIGYRLMPRFWGKGYATEGAIGCRDFAFSDSRISSLISIIHIDNLRSQKVALRNGMKPTVNTVWHDSEVVIFRIAREEWESLKR